MSPWWGGASVDLGQIGRPRVASIDSSFLKSGSMYGKVEHNMC